MKKLLAIITALALLCSFSGCTKQSAAQTEAYKEETTKSKTADPEVDVDLTVLSSTMVYSEVYNMMTKPEDYIGKTIKVDGMYDSSFFDQTGKYYHYVLIADATACCQQGIEFIWSGEHTYPEDYPDKNAFIELTGVFGTYEELDVTYYYLDVDEIRLT